MKNGVLIVPTGIGASIGGFAGDASKWARKFAKKCKLIVNPNVVNAACFSGITDNMLYVEGYTLDKFFKNELFLNSKETTNNKIGVVFDKAIPAPILNIHINTINAVKTVYDIEIIAKTITKEEVGVEFFIDQTGSSMGNVKNLNTLKDATTELIAKGCNAIAIVCLFPEEQGDNYTKGIGADPVGGVEAIISHYISKEFKLPCAHAPAFNDTCISTNIVDKRCAAEYITPTFLPCILIGLAQAPQISSKEGLSVKDIDFLCIPHNSLGCIPVLEAQKRNIKIYAIEENNTVLNINKENFQVKCDIIKTYEDLLELI